MHSPYYTHTHAQIHMHANVNTHAQIHTQTHVQAHVHRYTCKHRQTHTHRDFITNILHLLQLMNQWSYCMKQGPQFKASVCARDESVKDIVHIYHNGLFLFLEFPLDGVSGSLLVLPICSSCCPLCWQIPQHNNHTHFKSNHYLIILSCRICVCFQCLLCLSACVISFLLEC